MGTWDVGIFDNDTSLDIRDDYCQYIKDGLTGTEATNNLIQEHLEVLEKIPEMEGDFWLALAGIQWKLGRLENHVKQKALKLINEGIDLKNWIDRGGDPDDVKKRAVVLEKLKTQLESSQPPEKKIRVKFKVSKVWAIGDIIRYQLKSGNYCLFRIIDFDEGDDLCCFCELLDWYGTEIPSEDNLKTLQPRILLNADKNQNRFYDVKRFILTFEEKKQIKDKRLKIVAKGTQVVCNENDGCTLIMWPYLDDLLEKYCGLK